MTELWNGHQAAVSLTFDDGRPCHWIHAIPEMNKRLIPGTFFVITGKNEFDEEFQVAQWLAAIKAGHEIGSHSVNHKKAEQLNDEEAMYEADQSQQDIDIRLGVVPTSFCYPFTDVNDAIFKAAKKHYLQARGGRVARKDKFLKPGESFNFHNIPSYHIGSSTIHEAPSILLEALNRHAWVTLMFHTIGENDPKEWDKVTVDQFRGFLDLLVIAKQVGLWVAPFGTVATNLRGCMKT